MEPHKKVTNSSIHDFSIIKNFKITLHPPKASKIIEVLWLPPTRGWLKCNMNGPYSNSLASCGRFFRDEHQDLFYAFSELVEGSSSLHTELYGIIMAIDITIHFSWNKLWLKMNSTFVLLALQDSKVVSWNIKTKWLNIMVKVKSMSFFVTHIFREGNQWANKLAFITIPSIDPVVWTCILPFLVIFIYHNKLGMYNYRFVDHWESFCWVPTLSHFLFFFNI